MVLQVEWGCGGVLTAYIGEGEWSSIHLAAIKRRADWDSIRGGQLKLIQWR